MQYTMYYEEQQKIDYDEYGRLKQQLLQKEENQKNTLDTAKTQIQRGCVKRSSAALLSVREESG